MIELSASQIKASDECLRKWAFKYLQDEEDPGSVSTELGKDCHTGWEMWLRDGIAPAMATTAITIKRAAGTDAISIKLLEKGIDAYADRLNAICTSAIPRLPVPKSPNLKVEGEFHFEDHGVAYRGYKDLTWWSEQRLILHDHKTTSNLKWAKTQNQLREDVQLILYAQSEFQTWDIPEIECNWHYTTTDKTPTTRPVHLTVYRDEVNEKAAAIAERGKKLLKLYKERPDPNDLPAPADLAICDAYRGCPYKNTVCKLTPTERIRGAFRHAQERKEGMNFFERMKKAQPAEEPKAPEPSREFPSVAGTSTQPGTVAGIEAREARAAAAPTPLRQKLQAPPPSPGATGVMPAAPATTPLETKLEASVAQTAPVAQAAQPEAIRQPDSEVKPKSPGRPRKAKAAEIPVEVPHVLPAEGESNQAFSDRLNGIEGFTLFVNCRPQRQGITMLGDILAPLAKQIEEELKIPDYRLAEYGKGKDALVYALKERLTQDPLSGNVFVDLRTSEGSMCATTLAQFAAEVVQ